jgi:AsmA protein
LSLAASSANAAPAFALPFIVQGPWDDPIILPDPQSRIERSGAAAPILDAVRNRTARDAVRSAIERLTGAVPAPAAAPPGGMRPESTGAPTPTEGVTTAPEPAEQPPQPPSQISR